MSNNDYLSCQYWLLLNDYGKAQTKKVGFWTTREVQAYSNLEFPFLTDRKKLTSALDGLKMNIERTFIGSEDATKVEQMLSQGLGSFQLCVVSVSTHYVGLRATYTRMDLDPIESRFGIRAEDMVHQLKVFLSLENLVDANGGFVWDKKPLPVLSRS